jgi:hypothetical protein
VEDLRLRIKFLGTFDKTQKSYIRGWKIEVDSSIRLASQGHQFLVGDCVQELLADVDGAYIPASKGCF